MIPTPSRPPRGCGSPERFWGYLTVDFETGCWLWDGTCDRSGYGLVRVGARHVNTHRYAWELAFGPIPEDLFGLLDSRRDLWVLHRCDNPPCCNPAHLFLGTARDNTEDMFRKGRAIVQPAGEQNANARLSDTQVAVIRQRYASAGDRWGLQTQLAREFGCHQTTIGLIVRGQLRRTSDMPVKSMNVPVNECDRHVR
jgi:hypothetical protein